MSNLQAANFNLGVLTGKTGIINEKETALDAMLQNILTSSAIEGETLNRDSVRSSLAKRLGMSQTGKTDSGRKVWLRFCSMRPKKWLRI